MASITKKQAIKFWRLCQGYLESCTDIVAVRELANIEKLKTMNAFYRRLLLSLINRIGMPNCITVDMINDQMKSLLFNFSPKRISNYYGFKWEKLFDDIKRHIKPLSRMNKKIPQNFWVVFSKGALDGAYFLSQFQNPSKFVSFVNSFPNGDKKLPQLLSKKIKGFGFALACDFLKESGWVEYAKPDTHTKTILKKMKLSDGSDHDTVHAIQKIAHHVDETPYSVDKHIWLVGSGNLYNRNEMFYTSREKFFSYVKNLRKNVC